MAPFACFVLKIHLGEEFAVACDASQVQAVDGFVEVVDLVKVRPDGLSEPEAFFVGIPADCPGHIAHEQFVCVGGVVGAEEIANFLDARRPVGRMSDGVASGRQESENQRQTGQKDGQKACVELGAEEGKFQPVQKQKEKPGAKGVDKREEKDEEVLAVDFGRMTAEVSLGQGLSNDQGEQRQERKNAQAVEAFVVKGNEKANQKEGAKPAAAEFGNFAFGNFARVFEQFPGCLAQGNGADFSLQGSFDAGLWVARGVLPESVAGGAEEMAAPLVVSPKPRRDHNSKDQQGEANAEKPFARQVKDEKGDGRNHKPAK